VAVRKRLAGQFGLLGHSLPWTVPAAAAALVALHQGFVVGGDSPVFLRIGRTLLSSHWSSAYALPAIQAGPLQLLLYGSIGRSAVALALFVSVGTAVAVVAAARVLGVKSPLLLGGVGLLAVATGVTRIGYSVGHPADAVIPLVWIFAAAEARRGRTWSAGLLIGLSAGFDTWGVLGVAVLALAPRPRQACVGALVAGGTALALFVPFMLGGHFAMLSFAWYVRPPAPLSLLVAGGTPFGWPLRVAQALVAAGAGVVVARVLRDSPHALWAAPLAVVAARLLLDPLLYPYYLSAPQALIFVGAALGAARWTRLRSLSRESFA